MLSVQDAQHIVLSHAHRLERITVPLQQALGGILAEDLTAPDPLPPYPASTKVPASLELLTTGLVKVPFSCN